VTPSFLTAHPLADSALEHLELMAEDEHLGAELRNGAGADEHEVSNEADELVREAEKHAGGSCRIVPTILGRDSLPQPKRGYALSAPEGTNRTDASRFTAHVTPWGQRLIRSAPSRPGTN